MMTEGGLAESIGNHGDTLRRFSNARVAEHLLVMFTVGILVTTGLSQKFYHLDVSRWLILKLGGMDTVKLIHRFAGIVFGATMLFHMVIAVIGIALRKWSPSMMINAKDFSDAVHNIKYYAGAEDLPAVCDRYTYKQKFQYWGILTGGLLMILTGSLLWFPALVTGFLPGEFIPAAKTLHTDEALVIFLFISLWHIYNSIFSPEVFPLDTSIFTGHISMKRMLREHPAELARIEGVGLGEILKERQRDMQETG
jgi:formate dehydrogenase subunit gamma